jgi:chaperonin GroES
MSQIVHETKVDLLYYLCGTVAPRVEPLHSYLEERRDRTMAQTTIRATAPATTPTLRPLHDRLLVKRVEEHEEKHGRNLPLAVKQGDRILFGKYSGSEVKLDGEEYLIMKEEDVLGVLREEGRHA